MTRAIYFGTNFMNIGERRR